MKKRKKISICIPCYNEEENIPLLYERLEKVIHLLPGYIFEYIFVDNGSSDNTRLLIEDLAHENNHVRGIYLSRNFGPEASIQAALDHADGDAAIAMCADLEDPPELIPKFIQSWEAGNHIVLGKYHTRTDVWHMRLLRRLFYKVLESIAHIEIPRNVTGYGLFDKRVVSILQNLPEKYRFMRGLLAWVGWKKAYISYERKKRGNGRSSYRLLDYIEHSERGIFGFSYLPLDIMVYAGLSLVTLSFLVILAYLAVFFFFGNPIKGAVTIVVSILFFGGINILALSIIGKYIKIIAEEVKARPTYVIDEMNEGKSPKRL